MPACRLCGGKVQKRKNGLCQHFCLEKAAPPVLALMPDNSVPFSYVSGAFGAPAPALKLRGSLSTYVHVQVLQQELPGTPEAPHLIQPQSHWFYSQKLWGLLFLTLKPWTKRPGMRLGPLTPQAVPPQPRNPSQFLSVTHWCGTSPFLTCMPLPPVLMWLLLYILSCRTYSS